MIRTFLPLLFIVPALAMDAQVPDTAAQWATMVTGWRERQAYELVDTLPSRSAAATDGGGSGFVLRRRGPADPTEFGAASASVPAHAFRGRRVQVTAELRTPGVTAGASLWIRVDGVNGVLALDNGQEVMRTGDTEWRMQELRLDVPPEAERIVFGGLLRGAGELTVRRLLIALQNLRAADAPIAEDARLVFDSAVSIMRTHALVRDTVSWDVVIPEYRRRLAGAQKREDAYHVVAALARRLGDHHSFFRPPMPMTPQPATARRLKKLVADQGLDIAMLKDVAGRKW